jgi:uncharacterized protein YqjF (DUF2071 family)
MRPILTVGGRDVLFAHWPVDPAVVESHVPAGLCVETFDGSAWVSVLALENRAAAPGSLSPPSRLGAGTPQLNLRTYVSYDGDLGVYFLSLDTGGRATAAVGRRAFGLPFHHARMRLTRQGERVSVRSRRDTGDGPPAVFRARYRPTGERYRAEPGTVESFCVERFRYYLPATGDRRAGPLGGDDGDGGDGDDGGVRVGRIDRDPWDLRPVTATIRDNTLFEAAGLPAPVTDPVVGYSPGFEMGVEPVASAERRTSS